MPSMTFDRREHVYLTRACQPGDHVYWNTLGGTLYKGVLKEWDSNVAIVTLLDAFRPELNGTTKSVEC